MSQKRVDTQQPRRRLSRPSRKILLSLAILLTVLPVAIITVLSVINMDAAEARCAQFLAFDGSFAEASEFTLDGAIYPGVVSCAFDNGTLLSSRWWPTD